MNRFLGISLVTLNALLAGQGTTPDTSSVRRQIEAQYEKLTRALEGFDLKSFLALRSADFHTVGPDGRVLDAETMAEYSKRFFEQNRPPLRVKFFVQSIAVSPNETVAVVTVKQEVSRKQELAGVLRDVETSAVQDETWVQARHIWLLQSVNNVHDQKRFVNGKRVDPTTPYDPTSAAFDPDSEQGNALVQKTEIASASARQNSLGLTAWKLRDPDMFMRTVPKDIGMKKANGSAHTWASLYEDQKQCMRTVKHIDWLAVTIRIESVSSTDAVVLSIRNWSRVVAGPDGIDIRLKATVTHRETWHKAAGKWTMLRLSEEDATQEAQADTTIKNPVERYEIRITLEDTPSRRSQLGAVSASLAALGISARPRGVVLQQQAALLPTHGKTPQSDVVLPFRHSE